MLISTAPTYFISDLHLCASRPRITALLLEFLGGTARGAQALYVLGDLFEYWAGDDDLDDLFHRDICAAFRALTESGTPIALIHGNRDFLLGERFAAASGMQLLKDPTEIDLYGQRALLTHGDALCTDDVAYQSFRSQVRDPAWQASFLALPLAERKAQIEALRMRSESEKSMKAEAIMDVNDDAVRDLLREHGHPAWLIHGHTHRPASHVVRDGEHVTTRWVLGDWYEEGHYLRCDANGCEAIRFS